MWGVFYFCDQTPPDVSSLAEQKPVYLPPSPNQKLRSVPETLAVSVSQSVMAGSYRLSSETRAVLTNGYPCIYQFHRPSVRVRS